MSHAAQDRTSAAASVATVPEEVTGQPRRVVAGALPWRQTFAALKHRNFRLFFFGQLVSLIGTWMQNTAQSWLVYQLTGSKLLLGIVAAVGSAPMLLFSIWGGSVADRHPKRAVLLWTQSGMMVLAFVFAALVWSGLVRPWHILVLAALGGVAMAFDMPARQAFMVEMTSREDLMNALSLNSSIVNGARVVGPAVAGLLMAQAGLAACFFLNGLSFLAVLAGLLMMRLPRFIPPAQPESNWQHALDGFAYVAQAPPGAHPVAAVCHRRRLRLVVFGAAAGLCQRRAARRQPRIRDVAQRQRHRRAVRGADGRHLWRAAVTGGCWSSAAWGSFRLMLLLLAVTRNYYLALVFLAIAGWGMLLYFSTTNTADPDQRRRRHARAGNGHLGAGVRRHDAGGRHGSRRPVALARRAVGRCHRRGGVRRRGPGDVVVCATAGTPSSDMNTVIQLQDIHKTYHTGEVDVHAVRGVSLDISQGEFVALMGASGSGKSTMMNIIGCLDRPTQGKYLAGWH